MALTTLDLLASIEAANFAAEQLCLGRGRDYPLALESALKLKDISCIHAGSCTAGEMKHGPIALIDESVPMIVLVPSGPLVEKTVSTMQGMRARRSVVLISDREDLDQAGEGCLATIEISTVHPLIAMLVYTVPMSLSAFHAACLKSTNVDLLRNLVRSATV